MSRFAYYTVCMLGMLGVVWKLVDSPLAQTWILAGLGLAYMVMLVAGSLFPQLGFYLLALNRGPANQSNVALTFDDGPAAGITPRLLDLLKREGVPATFFCVGEAAQNHPTLVKRAAAEGHLIANHSYGHRYYWAFLSLRRLIGEFRQANQALTEILQRTPRFVRFPFGASRPGLARILHVLNLVNVGWDVRGLEGIYQDPMTIARRIARQARNGSIILLHEAYYPNRTFDPDTVLETVRLTIAWVRERGFTFVRLDHLLEQPGYAEIQPC